MRQHLISSCNYTEVPCEYRNLGCEDKMLRRDAEEHKRESREKHVDLALDVISLLEEHHLALMDGDAVFFKLSDFTSKESNESFISPAFYTSPGGYKKDMVVYVNGDGSGHHTHVSMFLRPLVGVYDSTLAWPFVVAVHIAILYQVTNENHYSQTFEFEANDNVQAGSVLRSLQFISHSHLTSPPIMNTENLKGDAVYCRATVRARHTKPWLMCT